MGKIKKAAYIATGIAGIALLGIAGMQAEQAQAACGYGVFAGDFYAACDMGGSEDGSVKVSGETVDGVSTLKITLNNYNGGGIYWECCATCTGAQQWQRTVVEVHGENKITEIDGTGVALNGVEFVGDGVLTIEAMIPVGGRTVLGCSSRIEPQYDTRVDHDALVQVLGNTIVTVDLRGEGSDGLDGGVQNVTDDDKGASDKDNKDDKDECPPVTEVASKDGDDEEELIWHIVAGVYMTVTTIALVIVGMKYWMKRDAEKAKKARRKNGQ